MNEIFRIKQEIQVLGGLGQKERLHSAIHLTSEIFAPPTIPVTTKQSNTLPPKICTTMLHYETYSNFTVPVLNSVVFNIYDRGIAAFSLATVLYCFSHLGGQLKKLRIFGRPVQIHQTFCELGTQWITRSLMSLKDDFQPISKRLIWRSFYSKLEFQIDIYCDCNLHLGTQTIYWTIVIIQPNTEFKFML